MTKKTQANDDADDAQARAEDAAADISAAIAGAGGNGAADHSDAYLRLAADFDNFRRRKAQELLDRARYAAEETAVALLPVLDNLRRAVEHAPADGADEFVSGVTMVLRDFEAAFERLGIVPIETVGERFDPVIHEAIGGDESDEVEYDTVTMELQRGYRLHDKVLRPALVRIAHPRHPATT